MSQAEFENTLVTRAQAGDLPALEDLLRESQELIYAVCRSMLRNDDDALDATQDALISIVKNVSRYRGQSAFSTWVYKIAANSARRQYGKGKRFGYEKTDGREVSSNSAGIEDHVIRKLALADAFDQLPDEFRETLALRHLAELSHAQIADALGISEGTVASRLSRGRKILINRLVRDEKDRGVDQRIEYGTS